MLPFLSVNPTKNYLGCQYFNVAFIWLTSQGVLQQMRSHEKYKSSYVSLLIPCPFISQAAHCYLPRGNVHQDGPSREGPMGQHSATQGDLLSGSVLRPVPLITEMKLLLWTRKGAVALNKVWEEGEGNVSQTSKELTYFLSLLGKNPPTSINTLRYWEYQSLWRCWDLWIQSWEVIWNLSSNCLIIHNLHCNYPSWLYFLQKLFCVLPTETCNPLKRPKIAPECFQAPKYTEVQ